MNWFMKVWLKFVTYDTLVKVIATALAYVLEYARLHSYKGGWEKAKETIHEVKKWVNLFDEVYEDDTLTEDEKKQIEDAIADCTTVASIYKLLLNKKAPKKGRTAKLLEATTKKVEKKPVEKKNKTSNEKKRGRAK